MSQEIELFLTGYNESVQSRIQFLRVRILQLLPGITEQLDLSARMIAYCYGQKYKELVCTIIPSKNGVKLGLNEGAKLPDPENWLEGTGKISRFVVIRSEEMISSAALEKLILAGYSAYLDRME